MVKGDIDSVYFFHELVPVQPLPQQQSSISESGSAEPTPPPPSQPVQLSQVPRAGTPRAPAQSTYVGQCPAGYVHSNYVGQGPQGQAGAKPAPKPSATSANAPGEQKYFGNNVVVAPADHSTPVQSQGRPAGAGTDYVQSVYLGQGLTNGQAGKPGQPGTKSLKSQASQETSVSPGKTAEEPSPGKLAPAPVGNQAELDRAAKEREKALEDQKRQFQKREEKEKAEARRLEAERKKLEEEKERLAREKEELDKEKERLAKLKAQKEKEAKEKEAKEGKEAKEQVKEKEKEVTKDVKAEPAERNAAKGGQTKPNHKYAGGPSLNVERKEKLNVEVEPGKAVYSRPCDRQQIVDITLKKVCKKIGELSLERKACGSDNEEEEEDGEGDDAEPAEEMAGDDAEPDGENPGDDAEPAEEMAGDDAEPDGENPGDDAEPAEEMAGDDAEPGEDDGLEDGELPDGDMERCLLCPRLDPTEMCPGTCRFKRLCEYCYFNRAHLLQGRCGTCDKEYKGMFLARDKDHNKEN